MYRSGSFKRWTIGRVKSFIRFRTTRFFLSRSLLFFSSTVNGFFRFLFCSRLAVFQNSFQSSEELSFPFSCFFNLTVIVRLSISSWYCLILMHKIIDRNIGLNICCNSCLFPTFVRNRRRNRGKNIFELKKVKTVWERPARYNNWFWTYHIFCLKKRLLFWETYHHLLSNTKSCIHFRKKTTKLILNNTRLRPFTVICEIRRRKKKNGAFEKTTVVYLA